MKRVDANYGVLLEMADMDDKNLWIAAVLLLLPTATFSSNCVTSKKFVVKKPQKLAAVFVDPAGGPVSRWGFELLSGKEVVRKLTTDERGAYDVGEIPAGKYRLRMTSYGFCTPKVDCKGVQCVLEPKLRLKGNPVVVY